MLRNQYRKDLVVKGTRYPFAGEGFCANRVAMPLLIACKQNSQALVLTAVLTHLLTKMLIRCLRWPLTILLCPR